MRAEIKLIPSGATKYYPASFLGNFDPPLFFWNDYMDELKKFCGIFSRLLPIERIIRLFISASGTDRINPLSCSLDQYKSFTGKLFCRSAFLKWAMVFYYMLLHSIETYSSIKFLWFFFVFFCEA